MLASAEQLIPNGKAKDVIEGQLEESPSASLISTGRPTSMVIKKVHSVIPAHLVAEAMSTLRGLDLRWSGPITPNEMQYVKQYVFAKYPQYCNGILEEADQYNRTIDLTNLCEVSSSECRTYNDKRSSPKNSGAPTPTFTRTLSELDKTQLEGSRLLDILTKKASFQGNFISIPEIQARNRALKYCGLNEDEYLVIFMPNYKDAMVMIGESYPFFKGNYYMSIVSEEIDTVREFATHKESKVIPMPETWLDLRIKGSQLSQYFRRKCKYTPKGLFCYPIVVNGTRYSLHWISEAHRNSWHVLLDATGLVSGEERLALALYRPDFVLCMVDNSVHAQPSKITCLLVRKLAFDASAALV